MPSTTPKMARTMAAAAHDPEFARRMGISMSVAKEFNDADAARVADTPEGKKRKALAKLLMKGAHK